MRTEEDQAHGEGEDRRGGNTGYGQQLRKGLAPLAWAVWVPPPWEQLGGIFRVACFATAGHFTMTMAFKAAPLTVTQPVTFLQLVWATALGAVVFAEPIDIWVVLGGAVILGSVTFITWREAMLKRQITPATPATKF